MTERLKDITFLRLPAIILCLFFLTSCASLYFSEIKPPAESFRIETLDELPCNELWQGFVFNGEKVGFTYLEIEPLQESGNFLITSEAELRILFLGLDKRISLRSEDIVRPDLTLVSFHYEQKIGGDTLTIDGKTDGNTFRAQVFSGDRTATIEEKLNNPLYPSSIINLYPVLMGMKVGSRYNYHVFDPQTQSITLVSQTVLSFEESKKLVVEPSFKIETTMYDQKVSTWINLQGESVFELGMNGVLITHKEEEDAARRFLIEAGFNKKDLILDFSLVKTEPPLLCPRDMTYLEIELEGATDELSPLRGPGQEVSMKKRGESDVALYRIHSDPDSPVKMNEALLKKEERYVYLSSTPHIESDNREIKERSSEITAGASDSLEKLQLLSEWVSQEIKDEAVDSFSALDVLHNRKGECQAHTMLFAAMARSAGIPTRLVGGLVYMEDTGFLYHSWTECYADGWISIDPTFNQVGTDATHIKLVEGPFWTSALKLGKVVGRINARIVDYESPCGKKE